MQTFLPYSSFVTSATVLDQKRLGKQRVENLQIMTALLEKRGWVHHPAVKMWDGFEWALLMYQDAICSEWSDFRGYRDTCQKKTWELYFQHRRHSDEVYPPWLEMEEFHISHQSNLIRKDPEYYGPRFPGVPDDLPYFWPI